MTIKTLAANDTGILKTCSIYTLYILVPLLILIVIYIAWSNVPQLSFVDSL